jgi:hypothetical protein
MTGGSSVASAGRVVQRARMVRFIIRAYFSFPKEKGKPKECDVVLMKGF